MGWAGRTAMNDSGDEKDERIYGKGYAEEEQVKGGGKDIERQERERNLVEVEKVLESHMRRIVVVRRRRKY